MANHHPKSARSEDKQFQAASGVRGRQCSWAGCTASCTDDLPGDRVNLLTWWAPYPEPRRALEELALDPFCVRDAALCGEHARALEALLIPLPGR